MTEKGYEELVELEKARAKREAERDYRNQQIAGCIFVLIIVFALAFFCF